MRPLDDAADERETLVRALDLHAAANIDFGEALFASAKLAAGVDTRYSHDHA